MSDEALSDALTELPDEFADDVIVPISALEHYSYCPRQCALIHVEQTFEENIFTVKGKLAHERVDAADKEMARGVRILRGVPVWSERYGVRGKADVVEMRREGPYPVEYKVGRRRGGHAEIQLCAQALCLEEMLGARVAKGAVFYHAIRRRHEVEIDEALREQTVSAIRGVRDMLRTLRLPAAPNDSRCPNCSLIKACLPNVVAERARLGGLQSTLFVPLDAEADDA